jgi:esterase/lipase
MARGRRGGVWFWVKRALAVVGALLALVVVVALVLAVIPIGTGGLGAEPQPAPTYADAKARFRDVLERETRVRPICHSRLLDTGRRTERVVVLFHGLTNCPAQMLALAERLHRGGANVLILRAPGHGFPGTVSNLADVGADDFRDYADESIDIGAGLGDQVTVLGLSLGGMLTAWSVQERPEVDRAVLVAPALAIGGVPNFVSTGFTNLFARLPNIVVPSGGTHVPTEYPSAIPTFATAQMFRLGKYVTEHADDDAPVGRQLALVLNDNDETISNTRAEGLRDDWELSGARVALVRFPKSLGMPHDVIDPAQPDQDIAVVYPQLVALVEGRPRPPLG